MSVMTSSTLEPSEATCGRWGVNVGHVREGLLQWQTDLRIIRNKLIGLSDYQARNFPMA